MINMFQTSKYKNTRMDHRFVMEKTQTYFVSKRSSNDEVLFMGNYRVIKELGSGTYGKVKLAVDTSINRQVALKFIKKSKLKKQGQVERVRDEARLMSIVEHPNLCKLYRAIENSEYIILEIEYIKGEELFEYISRKKKLAENEARDIFVQLIDGVSYLHQNRIIHRDLKPENIIIDDNGHIKIIDFGFATTYSFEKFITTHCGSPYYAAPEMVTGSNYIGPEVDIWSLGIVLYAMTHGYLPFEGDNVSDLYKSISQGSYKIERTISWGLSNLLTNIICLDTKNRASMIDVCRHQWVNHAIYVPLSAHVYPYDSDIIKKLKDFKFEKRFLMQNLANPYSAESCFYKLIYIKSHNGTPLKKIATILSEKDLLAELNPIIAPASSSKKFKPMQNHGKNRVMNDNYNFEQVKMQGNISQRVFDDTVQKEITVAKKIIDKIFSSNKTTKNSSESKTNKISQVKPADDAPKSYSKSNTPPYHCPISFKKPKSTSKNLIKNFVSKKTPYTVEDTMYMLRNFFAINRYRYYCSNNHFEVLIDFKELMLVDVIVERIMDNFTNVRVVLVSGKYETFIFVANRILNFY